MKKSDLLAYYQAQKVDRERMYTKPFRHYQQRRRLETVRALARQAGCLGQIIPVRNEMNGRLVNARVLGSGSVEWRR